MVGKGEVQMELCVVVFVGLVSALFSITLFIVQHMNLLHYSMGISYAFRRVVVDYRLFPNLG